MKTPMKYLVADVNKTIKDCLTLVEKRLGSINVPDIKNIEVTYELNSRNALGTCRLDFSSKKHIINLNPELLNELKEVYINEVVKHELCHALVHHKLAHDIRTMMVNDSYPFSYKAKKRVMPHGKEFKFFANMLGIKGSATTNIANGTKAMNKPIKTQARFTYHCNCQEFNLSAVRHNRIQNGLQQYTCKKCRTTISQGKLNKQSILV